jgi:hypothetical protein
MFERIGKEKRVLNWAGGNDVFWEFFGIFFLFVSQIQDNFGE